MEELDRVEGSDTVLNNRSRETNDLFKHGAGGALRLYTTRTVGEQHEIEEQYSDDISTSTCIAMGVMN